MIRGRNKRYKNAALRRKASIGPGGDNRLTRRTPITIESVVPGDTTTVIFDQDVVLAAPIGWLNNAGHKPIAQRQTAGDTIEVDYPSADTTTSIVVASQDPG